MNYLAEAVQRITSAVLLLLMALLQPLAIETSETNISAAVPQSNASASAVLFESPLPRQTPTQTASPASTPIVPVAIATPATEQYVMEDHPNGQDGFYVLKNAPSEPMSTVDELNQAVNNYRRTHGLNELFIDEQICQIAHQRAVEANQFFSHDGFSEHVKNGDYDYTGFKRISENLWDGSFSGVHIVEFGWDRSPGHRANLQGPWNRGCGGIFETTAAFIFLN